MAADDARQDDTASRERQHDELLQQLAHRFWVQKRTQQEIGEEFSFSRVSISRLLDEARRRQVVRFAIGPPIDRDRGLERALLHSLRAQSPAAARSLRTCRVVVSHTRGDSAHRWRLGLHAASTAGAHVPQGGTLAIASSRTTALLAAAAAEVLPRIDTVAELVGSGERQAGRTAGAELARAVGAKHLPVPAPFIHRSDERALSAQTRSRITAALEAALLAEVAVFGAGSMLRFDGSGAHAPVSAETLADAEAAGAVGHCLGVFLDARGGTVASALDAVRVGVDLRDLVAVPRRVLLAWTPGKAAISRAVAAFGLMTDLVTDDVTAREMLEPS